MTNDPVVHDQSLNQSFRQDIPRTPEPEVEGVKISWLKIVPKFSDILGVQVTAENFDTIARLHGYDAVTEGETRYIIVPGVTGDVRAFINDWVLIGDNNWDLVTVCSAAAFNRNYEVQS